MALDAIPLVFYKDCKHCCAGNMLALILMRVPEVNLIAHCIINGHLLWGEYFEFGAMRFMSQTEERQFRQSDSGAIFMMPMFKKLSRRPREHSVFE